MSEAVSSDWYVKFFSELPNEFWRRAVPQESTEAEVDFIVRHLGLGPNSSVVDVPCGSGRHSLSLATRQHEVVGIDLSNEAISYAKGAADNAGLEVEFLHADMREIPAGRKFDAAICMGNSFGYLELPETREFVKALSSSVRPGGGLVLDFNAAAESILPSYSEAERTMQVGDITVTAQSEYEVANSRLLSRYRFVRGEENLSTTAIHHVYTVAHLSNLLSEGGFVDIRLFSSPDDTEFNVGDGRLLITARRAAN